MINNGKKFRKYFSLAFLVALLGGLVLTACGDNTATTAATTTAAATKIGRAHV